VTIANHEPNYNDRHERVIRRINEMRDERAVSMRGGKSYLQVVDRVEAARREYGEDLGFITEIIHYGTAVGDPVVVKTTIVDRDGRVLATGHAEELRSSNERSVNYTSALENSETSSLGRALASLGFGGGEFASANEIDGVGRKTEAKKKPVEADPLADDPAPVRKQIAAPEPAAEPETILREPGDETTTSLDLKPADGETWGDIPAHQWETTALVMKGMVTKFGKTGTTLLELWTKNSGVLDAMEKHAPASFADVKAHFGAKRQSLMKKKD